VAAAAGVPLKVLPLDLRAIGGSALTDDIDVPVNATSGIPQGIPITYVPARNTILLSLALGYAEVRGASDIFIGVNAVDYSGYPDCRPEFIAAFQRMSRLATKAGVEGAPVTIHTPLIDLSKDLIIRQGIALGVDYGLTAAPAAQVRLGRCDSAAFGAKASAAGIPDPTRYTTNSP
jgi:7-cyano-7-deazaguanine synthase